MYIENFNKDYLHKTSHDVPWYQTAEVQKQWNILSYLFAIFLAMAFTWLSSLLSRCVFEGVLFIGNRMKVCECNSSLRLHCLPGRNICYALFSKYFEVDFAHTVWHLWCSWMKNIMTTPQFTLPCYDVKLRAWCRARCVS